MLYRLIINFVIIMVFLSTGLLEAAESMNQNILAESKIKKSSFKRAFKEIKKTLPQELKKCQIIVKNIKFLNADKDSAEEWAVDVCEEKKVYFVYGYLLKGYSGLVVKLKEEQFAKEKEIWTGAKKFGDEETWRKTLFYFDEIEAMSQEGNSQNIEKNSQ